MPTILSIVIGYAFALLSLIALLLVQGIGASLIGSGEWFLLLSAASIFPGAIFSCVCRRLGIEMKGASPHNSLRIALAGSWLFIGFLFAYLGYAVISWVLYRGQPGTSIPGLFAYIADPVHVKALSIAHDSGAISRTRVDLLGFSIFGAILAYLCVSLSLWSPTFWNPEPLAEQWTDSKTTVYCRSTAIQTRNRVSGILLTLPASLCTFGMWMFPESAFSIDPLRIIAPTFAVIGMGLVVVGDSKPLTLLTVILAIAVGFTNWLIFILF